METWVAYNFGYIVQNTTFATAIWTDTNLNVTIGAVWEPFEAVTRCEHFTRCNNGTATEMRLEYIQI